MGNPQKHFEAVTASAVIDPVCGMTVQRESAAGSFEHDGQIYYFCSTHCLKKFKANPERFLKQAAQTTEAQPIPIHTEPSAARAADTSEFYTCPMHPEVRQNKPRSCPKCGMALEPAVPHAPTQKIEYTCPMHPQVVSDKPGHCPICGMALEPRRTECEANTPQSFPQGEQTWTELRKRPSNKSRRWAFRFSKSGFSNRPRRMKVGP